MKKHTTRIWGWLVVAATLTTGFTACSGEDITPAIPVQPEVTVPTDDVTTPTGAVSTVHVSVGAGFGDDDEATTRADVEVSEPDIYGKLTRRLIFTAGDRLFIREFLDYNEPYKYLAGYLSIDAMSIRSDGKSATFSGDLKVYAGDGSETTFDFGGTDPLEFSPSCKAFLVPVDMADGFITIDKNYSEQYNYAKSIAANVNTLMKTALKVSGSYNNINKHFLLGGDDAILNCSIGGLTEGSVFTVKLRGAASFENYNNNQFEIEKTYATKVTVDSQGYACFAIGIRGNIECYWGLQLIDDVTQKEWSLGQKYLETKVYNVSKYYTP